MCHFLGYSGIRLLLNLFRCFVVAAKLALSFAVHCIEVISFKKDASPADHLSFYRFGNLNCCSGLSQLLADL